MSQECPACRSNEIKRENLPSREGFPLVIHICGHCGHYFQDIGSYEDLYSSGKFSLEARQSLEPTPEKIKELDKRAFERLRFYEDFIKDHRAVLEIGSSIGSFLHLLKMKGKDVTGLEPDPVYAAFSQKQYFFSQHSDLLENYVSNQEFDLLCSFHVIEHVQYLKSFIDKVWSLLEDKGALLFECPSLDIHAYGDMRFTIWKPHMHYFTLASMYALISQRFEIVELGYYGMSIFVYARKSQTSTFNENRFKSLKRKSRRISTLVSLTPALGIKSFAKNKIKQFVLQPVLQKDGRIRVQKYVKLGAFGLKSIAYRKKEEGVKKNRAVHVSYFSGWENAGDTVLSKTVRKVFNSKFDNSWILRSLKDKVDNGLISTINRSSYLLVGGGGLLLPDSNKNAISGWQWAVASDQLRQIEVPVIIYAIGYNYFKGQIPDDFFVENLNHLVERADFFSLRNFGSINRVKELIDPKLHNKIIYQPCPTTVINKFFKVEKKTKSRNVGINLAFDRYERRFGENIYLILDQLALVAKKLEKTGYKIFCVNHLQGDNKFEISLRKHDVKYTSVNLQYTLPQRTLNFYNQMEIVLGARGHAQMIPFGMGTRIISLGTHDKLRFFLEDIDELDWYEDVTRQPENLSERLIERFYRINEEKKDETDEKIRVKQEELYKVTMDNLRTLRNFIK